MGKDSVALRKRIALITFQQHLKLTARLFVSYDDMQRALDLEGRIGSLPTHTTQTCRKSDRGLKKTKNAREKT